MREFFKGWQRKAGCVTLVMAIATAGAWMRSTWNRDLICLTIGLRSYTIVSIHGQITVWTLMMDPSTSGSTKIAWQWLTVANPSPNEFYAYHKYAKMSRVLHGDRISGSPPMHYWMLTAPLTLLAAYLILWQGKRVTKQVANSEGA